MVDPPGDERARTFVITVCSNKGGVGKTTVASNLAIYLRAIAEDLPVLLVGLDDQRVVDRMFGLRERRAGERNLKHAWAERSFSGVMQLGQYGIHFVPSPVETNLLRSRAEDPTTLRGIVERSAWHGVVIIDTKSALDGLTVNAICAADRVIVPVADRSSLDEAGKIFEVLRRNRRDPANARVLLTLIDRRTRVDDRDLLALLEEGVRRRGWRRYETFLSRSPRVETLNSGAGRPLSILHHGQGTAVHGQLRRLAREVYTEISAVLPVLPARREARRRAPAPGVAGEGTWKSALLSGLRRSRVRTRGR